MKKITQKKILFCYLLSMLLFTFAIGFVSVQEQMTSETQPSLKILSSSYMKFPEGMIEIPYSYMMESEVPHPSAIKERPTIGDVSILAMPVLFFELTRIKK